MSKHRIALFCLLVFFVGCGGGGSRSTSERKVKKTTPEERNPYEIDVVDDSDVDGDVVDFAEYAVKKILKIPDNTPFFELGTPSLRHFDFAPNRFRVDGVVRTKNASGDEITQEYTTWIQYDSRLKKLELIEFELDHKILYEKRTPVKIPESKRSKINRKEPKRNKQLPS